MIVTTEWVAQSKLPALTVYPEILQREEFWQDRAAGFSVVKYLGSYEEGIEHPRHEQPARNYSA
jgi:hypothetical protein